MTFKGHILNSQIDPGLPFYSQVLLTSSSFYKNNNDSNLNSKNTFLFKSLDPLITKDDIKNLISNNKELSNYLNVEKEGLEIVEKGRQLYSAEAQNNSSEIPKILTVNCSPSFYSDPEPFLSTQSDKEKYPSNISQLQKMCDEYMSKYDLEKELSKKLRQKVITDEEGFQLVTAGPLPVKASTLPLSKKKKTKT